MGAAAGVRDSRGADRCRTACVRPREAALLLAPGYHRQLPRLAEVPTIPGVRASPEFIGRSRLFYCAHDGPMIGRNRYGTEFVIDSVRHCRIVMPIFFEQGDHLGGLLVVQNRTLENQPLAPADELIFPPFPGKNTRLSRGLLQAGALASAAAVRIRRPALRGPARKQGRSNADGRRWAQIHADAACRFRDPTAIPCGGVCCCLGPVPPPARSARSICVEFFFCLAAHRQGSQ